MTTPTTAPTTTPMPSVERVGCATDVSLVMSRWLQVERIDAATATIYLQSNGKRLRVPRALYDLLRRFESPATLLSVAGSPTAAARLATAIASLRDKGFLLAEGEQEPAMVERLTTDPPLRLFDCPAQTLAPALAEVVAIGVPYDGGDPAAAGARTGATALREASMQTLYSIDRSRGQPQGWYDTDRGCPILRGVSFCDAGDVFVDHGERQSAIFGRLSEALTSLTASGALPVLLGGDATVSFPALRHLQARAPLTVIRIGRLDAGTAQPDAHASTQSPTHAFIAAHALPQHALQLPGIERYLQVGPYRANPHTTMPSRFVHVPVEDVQRSAFAALAPWLTPGQPVYVGIDMAALATPLTDIDVVTGRPLFDYTSLHALLCGIGAAHPIVGLDVVGLNPALPCWRSTAMTALHLLLIALSAAKDGDGRNNP